MKLDVKKLLLTGALGLSLLAGGGVVSAGTACDPKDPKCVCDPKDPKCAPTGTPCSPGYWKNHTALWVGIFCTDTSNPTCAELFTALTCKGSDATCGRSVAAAFLNQASGGCTE